MLAGNAAMSSLYAAFEMRPEALDGVGVCCASYPFFAPVIHRTVAIADLAQRAVSRRFVRADGAASGDVLLDDREQGGVLRVRDDIGHQIAAALDHAEYGGLVVSLAGAADLGAIVLATTDVGFVNLDMPGEAIVTVNDAHELADLVTDAPCGLVCHA